MTVNHFKINYSENEKNKNITTDLITNETILLCCQNGGRHYDVTLRWASNGKMNGMRVKAGRHEITDSFMDSG